MDPGNVLEGVLSVFGYPRVTHSLLNHRSETVTLEVAPSGRLSRRCLLRGHVELGPKARLSARCVCNGDVTVGRGTNVEPECEFVGDVEIGNYCAIARKTVFQQTNHETTNASIQRRLYETVLDSELEYSAKGEITVGSDVWFGARCIVLSGVTIGHGAVVAAGSVVTEDVEPYAVVAGVPAGRVKWRFPRPVREALLELAWWEWDERRIRAHRDFFERKLEDAGDVPTPAGARSGPADDPTVAGGRGDGVGR